MVIPALVPQLLANLNDLGPCAAAIEALEFPKLSRDTHNPHSRRALTRTAPPNGRGRLVDAKTPTTGKTILLSRNVPGTKLGEPCPD